MATAGAPTNYIGEIPELGNPTAAST